MSQRTRLPSESRQVPESPVEGSLEVRGATLRFRQEGQGPAVLVVGSSVYYPRTFSAALRASCRLSFMDLRHFAHGNGSGLAKGITLNAYCEDIEAMCVELGLERFVLMGHSHHGNVALEYAKRYPGRVSRLVLIGTPPCDVSRTLEAGQHYWDANASGARKTALEQNHALLDESAMASLPPGEAFVARYVADGPRFWYDPHYDATPLWQGVPIDTEAFTAFRNFFVDYRFYWRLVDLSAPVLVVMGRHDYVVPPTLWESRLPDLPPVTYRLLERSGHTPQLEEPEAFARLLLEWLGLGKP
ncbi:alpha/beta fold hydrolase [Billgrantia kenyensis]|uniref:Alpha/beta hydrolase n=1 Tax=Billgrantia kenyensis TaxID=321266 RepID=A0A7V9W4U3_9GAMM|nr:alpha/beta hydrolase [Halomonas kenyensis]MBA2781080.1 alpha/beta hydrolase [Halomonas kenyensis]MCG6663793.1 alpha/beta hydrolase [Halomonas kenyensis]